MDDNTSDAPDTAGSEDELTVQIDGKEFTLAENVDFDGDGRNDVTVLRTDDGGKLALADTDHDGVADVAVEYDEYGNPVAGAEFDPATGVWQVEDVDNLPTPSGDGADEAR
ncbi:hypothetical protein [Actinophytocola oryzae]|uniref:Uncharacterized protein n=1 Tax=Actinophytocola oryzae TaxID=502181 RepID=A0A4R7W7E5_9PSEU|nr:hypothetical protein [Actinophytocola oryzae]TDV57657.1 hypothetical protein CLV71_101530 [Actinophytocola oryzae]